MRIEKTNNKNKYFYATMGRVFGNRRIHKEMGAYLFDDDNKVWFLAKKETEVVGFVSVKTNKRNDIGNLYVFPENRKKGVGSLLIQKALEYAAVNDLSTHTVANKNSRSLFVARGFVVVRTTKNYAMMELQND